MQGPLGQPTLPTCKDCGARTARVVGYEEFDPATNQRRVLHQWLCAGCEYKRLHPDAAEGVAYPRAMPPLKPQRETLFDVA